jgi:hypothetical protein
MIDQVEREDGIDDRPTGRTDRGAGEALEARVRRLEDAVTALQDTNLMEQRLLERLRARPEMASPELLPGSTGFLLDAGRMLLPRAVEQFTAATEPDVPPPNPHPPQAALLSPPAAPALPSPKRGWLLMDLVRELRTFLQMYFDYRFHLSWTARFVPLAAAGVFLVSWLLIRNLVLIVGPLLDYAIFLVLVVVTYKVLSREAARYREQMSYYR